jgi:hypothetical protein
MGVCCLSSPDGTQATYPDEDPALYDDRPAGRRASSRATFGGSPVWQDFGVKDVDGRIRLRTDWMRQAMLDAFQAKFAQKEFTYPSARSLASLRLISPASSVGA